MGQLTPAQARAKNRQNFLAFWEVYPKHQKVNEAERVFSEVVEGTASRPGVDPIMLIEKARSYARNTDPSQLEWVPQAHNWLRDGQYADVDLFTDQKRAEKEWLQGCFQRCDVAAVENRLRVKMPRWNLPEGMQDPQTIKQWYKRKAQSWILSMKENLE